MGAHRPENRVPRNLQAIAYGIGISITGLIDAYTVVQNVQHVPETLLTSDLRSFSVYVLADAMAIMGNYWYFTSMVRFLREGGNRGNGDPRRNGHRRNP